MNRQAHRQEISMPQPVREPEPKPQPQPKRIPLCDYNSLVYLSLKGGTYYTNGCITGKNRIFYKVCEEGADYSVLTTCSLTSDYKVVNDSIRALDVHSDKIESLYEDVRAIEFNGHWFVLYSDSGKIGVAKLKLDTCEVVYSHYLERPASIKPPVDGNEHDWTPFVCDGTICVVYSDTPRQIVRYKDTEMELKLDVLEHPRPITQTTFGVIHGVCSPVTYDKDHFIWFFYTIEKGVYHIGAYITRGYHEVIHVVDDPILIGQSQPVFKTNLTIVDSVVRPCGAIETETGWLLSVSVNEYKIGLLHVPRSLLTWSPYIPVTE